MRTRWKGWLGAAALLLGWAGGAAAADADSLTVTITPAAQYAVDIDTANGASLLDLGAVNLGASTFTVRAATVQVNSTYAQTDLTIVASIPGGDGWTVDNDTTTQATDSLQAWAVFTDTSIPSTTDAQALSGAFDAADLLTTSARDVGQLGGGTLQYQVAAGSGHKTMEDLPSSASDAGGSQAHLWLKFKLPPATTTVTAKHVTVTVAAGAPN